MKILGLSGGSTNGNTELLLKLALEAAKAAAPPDTTIDLVRIPDVSVPKHYLNASNVFPKDVINAPAHDDDDRPFVLDLILEAEAIILCCPIYTRVIPGSVKLFQDKTLGPFVDSVMAKRRKDGTAARFDKKRVAGLMAVGGALASEWASLGLPVMHQMFFPLGVKVVDQFHVYGCGLTGSVLLKEEAVEQARRLGRNVVEQAMKEEKQFVGEREGTCPLCHLDAIVLTGGGKVDCATCGAKGRLEVVNGDIKVVFDEEGRKLSVLTEEGKKIHFQEIQTVGRQLKPRMGEVKEWREKLEGLDKIWLTRLPSKAA